SDARVTAGLDLLAQLFGDGADVAIGTARRDDHEVAECRLALEWDGDDVLGFRVVKPTDDIGEESGRVRHGGGGPGERAVLTGGSSCGSDQAASILCWFNPACLTSRTIPVMR